MGRILFPLFSSLADGYRWLAGIRHRFHLDGHKGVGENVNTGTYAIPLAA